MLDALEALPDLRDRSLWVSLSGAAGTGVALGAQAPRTANRVATEIHPYLEQDITTSAQNLRKIGANTVIRNSVVGSGVRVFENCVIENSIVGDNGRIGPFSRLRPDTELASEVHIGNFVEIKKSLVGLGSKVNHLSYIGDTEIGEGVNIGAGTITCNYDGANKHRTLIGDGAFIGSNTALVAPVTGAPLVVPLVMDRLSGHLLPEQARIRVSAAMDVR